jgi:hypothetical protein
VRSKQVAMIVCLNSLHNLQTVLLATHPVAQVLLTEIQRPDHLQEAALLALVAILVVAKVGQAQAILKKLRSFKCFRACLHKNNR